MSCLLGGETAFVGKGSGFVGAALLVLLLWHCPELWLLWSSAKGCTLPGGSPESRWHMCKGSILEELRWCLCFSRKNGKMEERGVK